MKKLVAVLGLSLLFALPSFAQSKRDRVMDAEPQERVDKMMAKMTKELNLTESQQKEIAPLLLAQHEKRMAEHKRKKAEHKEMIEKMKIILNPEQLEAFKKHLKKRKGHYHQRGERLPTNSIED